MAATVQYPASGVRYKTRTRSASPISGETGIMVGACVLALVAYAFLQLFVASEVAGTLKSIVALETQQKRLLVEYDQLVLEAERLQAPGTVEVSAIRLGLKPLATDRTP